MRRARVLELPIFLLLAGSAHLAALTLLDLPGGSGTAGGEGGNSEISLQASPDFQSLAEQWDTPPETAPEPTALTAPENTAAPHVPDRPADRAPQRPDAPALPEAPSDTLPDLDSRLPAPPGIADALPAAPAQPVAPQDSPVARTAPLSPTLPRAPAPALAIPQTESLPAPDTTPAEAPLPEGEPVLNESGARAPEETPRHAARSEAIEEAAISALAPATSRRPAPRPEDLQIPEPVAKPTPAPKTAPVAKSKPKPSSTAQPARKAAGTGGAPQASPAKPQPNAKPGPSAGQVANARAKWESGIARAAQRAHRYPRGTSARGITVVKITVSANGALVGASVVQSSGNAALDRAAVQNMRRARFPKAPAEMGGKNVSILFRANFG